VTRPAEGHAPHAIDTASRIGTSRRDEPALHPQRQDHGAAASNHHHVERCCCDQQIAHGQKSSEPEAVDQQAQNQFGVLVPRADDGEPDHQLRDTK